MAKFKLQADTKVVRENGNGAGNVLANDGTAILVTQAKTNAGIFVQVSPTGTILQGIYGSLTIATDGTYSYTASTAAADGIRAGTTATDTFTYSAVNGSGTSASTTLKITVSGVNDAPLLPSTSETLNAITEDQIANGGQLISSFLKSTDVDSGALRGVAITGLTTGNGQWQYSVNGGRTWSTVGTVGDNSALLLRSTDYVRFVPNGATGTAADFTYRAWDQSSGLTGTKVDATINGGETALSTGTATASIVVSNVNDAPGGVVGSASGTEDGAPIIGQVHATDVDSTTLTYALVANSAVGGSVSIDPTTGNYSFTPAHDFNGTASFRFTASDGSLTSASTPVNIAIAAVNDAPIAVNDNGSTTQGVSVLLNVLANDTDVDGNPLIIASVGSAGHGTTLIENGQVRYTPTAGYVGTDVFNYSISDGAGGTAQASVGVSVQQSSQPSAVSITFRQGNHGYSGASDTMLKQNVASTSYADTFVLRSGLELGKDEQVLLKFSGLFGTGPGQIPVGATIVSATLQLETTGASTDGGTLNRMLVNWNDSSTWNSLGNGVQANGIEATSSGIAIGAVGLGSRVIDVTESLLAWNSAASTSAGQNAANLGWVFKPTGTDIWDFSSSQGAVRPVLTITYSQQASVPASLPMVSITATGPVAENSGTATFNLALSEASTQAVTVFFSTMDNTAKAGSDYVSAVRSLTFAPGETTKSFDIGLINNSVGERLETFTVQIDSATNATILTPVATGQITDDDVIVPPMPTLSPSIVAMYEINNGGTYLDGGSGAYGISDPSGLAYIPSPGRMLVADSEHDETPFLSPTNLFSLGLNGSYVSNYSLNSFTKEPTGLGYDAVNGFLYIADDDKHAVSWVSPTNPTVQLGVFDTLHLGLMDTEDLKIDPLTGHIHILDGVLKQMIELTDQGVFVDSVPLPAIMKDAEALAYDPVHDLYFVASGAQKTIWIIDAQGHIEGQLDLFSAYTHFQIKGLEYAPSSDPNDGNAMSLYVADYGTDQVNDGRLFEIHLGNGWFT